jgi:hypothetical protein
MSKETKKSVAAVIFGLALADRSNGLFASNKDFRNAVLTKIEADMSVSRASAATMYNALKKEAEVANPELGLGRDPRKVKVKVEGAKRGRPAGSGKKVVEVATDAVPTETAIAETATA